MFLFSKIQSLNDLFLFIMENYPPSYFAIIHDVFFVGYAYDIDSFLPENIHTTTVYFSHGNLTNFCHYRGMGDLRKGSKKKKK